MPNILLDPTQRSSLMASIHSKNTKPEMIVFDELERRGVRFRRHYEKVLGNPDLARPIRKLAVFIDGDFWHGREIDRVIARYGEKSSWAQKLRRTMARDLLQEAELRSTGWAVLRVWESDIKRLRTRTAAIDQIQAFLESRD